MYQQALVVGKFCPLHRGHQHLIDAAHRQSRRVVIISYTSTDYGYPAQLRQSWLERLYPQATIIVIEGDVPDDDAPEAEQRDFCALLVEQLGLEVDAVFSSELYGDGFAEHLGQRWCRHVAHVLVDLERRTVPISGTELRAARGTPKYLEYTDPVLHLQRPKRILLIGSESSGKTTLCRRLAERTGSVWVPEYGRTFGEGTDNSYTYRSLLFIAQTQVIQEDEMVLHATALGLPFVFCDTSPLVTAFYSQEWYEMVHPDLLHLSTRQYDLVLFCQRDFGYVDDGSRNGLEFGDRQVQYYTKHLRQSFVEVRGTIESRLAEVLRLLG